MRRRLLATLLLLAGIGVLQQALAWGVAGNDQLARQRLLIEQRDIDPAALFYTESPLALAAEKRVTRMVRVH